MPSEFSNATLERLLLIEAERDRLRDLVKKLTRSVRELLELHDPKESTTFEAQRALASATDLVALVELLPRTITPS
jgi:hypothetical protein